MTLWLRRVDVTLTRLDGRIDDDPARTNGWRHGSGRMKPRLGRMDGATVLDGWMNTRFGRMVEAKAWTDGLMDVPGGQGLGG